MNYYSPCSQSRNMYDQTRPGMQMPFGMPGTLPTQQAMPALPTGMPTGPSIAGSPTPMLPVPIAPPGEQSPQTLQSTQFTPGFLRTQIGRRMRVEFLIGTGALVDRIGTLVGVGASYILLRAVDSNDIILCDIYSIKFVTIISPR